MALSFDFMRWLTENVALVSSLTALVAVVLGPLVSLYVARREINAQLVSANRQVWINTLRAAVANYLTELATDETKHREPVTAIAAAHARVRKMSLYVTEISLLINPNELLHQKLLELVRAATVELKESLTDPSKIPMRHRAEIIEVAQKIFKEEWIRVKSGK